MTRSATLIFNPIAGQGDPEQDLRTIWKLLEPDITLDIQMTSKEVGANELAKQAIERGIDLLIASGGDGTISSAADAAIGTGIPFAVIPRGTANAFAGALGLPNTIQAACETILGGHTRVVDAATCNGKPMVLLAGIGLEAEAVEQADRESKNWLGKLAYVIAGLTKLGEIESFEAEIEIDNFVSKVQAIAVTIANAAPPTSVLAQGAAGVIADDGLLDVTIVTSTNQLEAINAMTNLLGTALLGTAAEREDIIYLRTKRIKVTTEPAQKVVLDGELIGTTSVEIECIPGGLTVVVPATEETTEQTTDEATDETTEEPMRAFG
ncbi:YegS/Rv2252/BmrU family lipid kinase [Microcoleus sp. FACHB-672]|uniref:YegS/Rv2252/BmrU family lipid kinase n=1 Tax=Microcoleus sp. FACHB-672 TaxID=2692825 RepID=UPI001686C9B1|nr:YegS/Rv2252/BmrU family lipid kinase [Microcoleus sp. FACHB-672]MBD2040162.1 YegS/Rv2252/BmrU family lipid kinase [Microcoleus sp. FACHB-672]